MEKGFCCCCFCCYHFYKHLSLSPSCILHLLLFGDREVPLVLHSRQPGPGKPFLAHVQHRHLPNRLQMHVALGQQNQAPSSHRQFWRSPPGLVGGGNASWLSGPGNDYWGHVDPQAGPAGRASPQGPPLPGPRQHSATHLVVTSRGHFRQGGEDPSLGL